MSEEMPEWPSDFSLYETCDIIEYERSMKDAALARLRVAVEALETIRGGYHSPRTTAMLALQEIGPLPSLPPRPGNAGEA